MQFLMNFPKHHVSASNSSPIKSYVKFLKKTDRKLSKMTPYLLLGAKSRETLGNQKEAPL